MRIKHRIESKDLIVIVRHNTDTDINVIKVTVLNTHNYSTLHSQVLVLNNFRTKKLIKEITSIVA